MRRGEHESMYDRGGAKDMSLRRHTRIGLQYRRGFRDAMNGYEFGRQDEAQSTIEATAYRNGFNLGRKRRHGPDSTRSERHYPTTIPE